MPHNDPSRGGFIKGEKMQVQQLRPTEGVAVDQDRLGALYAEVGAAEAEEALCRAMEDIAKRMTQCDSYYRAGKLKPLRGTARGLIKTADAIGMHSLSRVAGDVTDCIDRMDEVALTATLSRLIRIGERSLIAIWDLQDAKT
jgi:hypothetical protein